jgi:RNA polymerase sigma-70 factor, ECF subfamily
MAELEEAVTRTLAAVDCGDDAAAERLEPEVYDLLRRVARHMMSGERRNHTLTATALVHEAYLRVAGDGALGRRRYFYIAAAEAMRRILIDHARGRMRGKRGGGAARADIEVAEIPAPDGVTESDVEPLHEALDALRAVDERRYRVVSLRYFTGLSETEVAEILGITDRTVRRDWEAARAWLKVRMSPSTDA